jgi:hypothetical protein
LPEEAKGKDYLSKMCRETNRHFMVRSRHQYPLCSEEYIRKTHRKECERAYREWWYRCSGLEVDIGGSGDE